MKAEKEKILCKACHTENDADSKVCRKCGLSLIVMQTEEEERTIICPRCNNSNPASRFFCYSCGKYFVDAEEAKKNKWTAKGRKGTMPPPAKKACIIMPGGSEIALTGAPVYIERSDFDCTLANDLLMCISRQHVLITYSKGKYYVQDYGRDGKGSTNHTKVNDVDIFGQKKKYLKDGDRIEVACQPELTLTFKYKEEDK